MLPVFLEGRKKTKYLYKDFHGTLNFCLVHLHEIYGAGRVRSYLEAVGRNCYVDLIAAIKKKTGGLARPPAKHHDRGGSGFFH